MTNNQLAENSVNQLLNSVRLARDNAERADNRVDHSFYFALTIALEELQERRKADSEPVAWTDEEELRDANESGSGYLFGIERDANKFADPRRQIMLYRHAQPAVSKPWGYTSGILNPAVGMACVTPTRGKNQFPVYLDPQPAPVVPVEMNSDKAWGELKISAEDCQAWSEGWNACRAAMLQAEPVTTANKLGNTPVIPDCWCRTCRPVALNDMRFVVCPDCGNKRCPRANDHRNSCTWSNEPGQEGSAYPAAPQEVKP